MNGLTEAALREPVINRVRIKRHPECDLAIAPRCVLCGGRHVHGAQSEGPLGNRGAHCGHPFDYSSLPSYDLYEIGTKVIETPQQAARRRTDTATRAFFRKHGFKMHPGTWLYPFNYVDGSPHTPIFPVTGERDGFSCTQIFDDESCVLTEVHAERPMIEKIDDEGRTFPGGIYKEDGALTEAYIKWCRQARAKMKVFPGYKVIWRANGDHDALPCPPLITWDEYCTAYDAIYSASKHKLWFEPGEVAETPEGREAEQAACMEAEVAACIEADKIAQRDTWRVFAQKPVPPPPLPGKAASEKAPQTTGITKEAGEDKPTPSSKSDAAHSEIEKLAELGPVEYELHRVETAKKLNMRTSVLDSEVRKLRDKKEDTSQGTAMVFNEPEPWPVAVNGVQLLNQIVETLNRFLVLPKHGAHTIALWILFTYVFDVMKICPILIANSPEKRCGKTSLLKLILELARMAVPTSNIPVAPLFRLIEKYHPTICMDEMDTYLPDNPGLGGVINSGHDSKFAFTTRCVGDDFEVRFFSTWTPKALAIIGESWDKKGTLPDRSIIIRMPRKKPSEVVERLRHFDGTELKRMCIRWADDHVLELKHAVPEIPASLNDRAADNWEPLLSIADLIGGDWPERARAAAIALSGIEERSDSLNTELLADIRGILKEHSGEYISTKEVIEKLCADDDAPWASYNRGKPITARQLAKRLRDFGITVNQTRRIGKLTVKGYKCSQFNESFERYLPDTPVVSVTQSQINSGAVSSDISISHTSNNVTDDKTLEPNTGAGCDLVTDEIPPDGNEVNF